MSRLEEYIEEVKKHIGQVGDMSETEIIRYVYIDLGKKFSFNLKFAFGNSKTKRQIYTDTIDLDEIMKNNTIVCSQSSKILEYILKKFDIDILTVEDDTDERSIRHVNNLVRQKDGKKYIIDLQDDIPNIQSHSFTKSFGLSVERNSPPVITRFELEQIDRKIGYIDSENYYSDDYLYLLKSDIGYFDTLQEKAKFVLENIEVYENRNMKYAERKWSHERILQQLFSTRELQKLVMIDCYQGDGEERTYINSIVIDNKEGADVYLYSIDECRYKQVQISELYDLINQGLVMDSQTYGLKKALKEYSKSLEER